MSKPATLNEKVAEAIGATPKVEWWIMNRAETAFYITFENKWEAQEDLDEHLRRYPEGLYEREGALIVERRIFPRYDADWAVTGPLIEKYAIVLQPPSEGYWKQPEWHAHTRRCISERGATPLIAVCNLLVALKAAGKLIA